MGSAALLFNGKFPEQQVPGKLRVIGEGVSPPGQFVNPDSRIGPFLFPPFPIQLGSLNLI